MVLKKWFLIALSALLFNLALNYPLILGWLIFLYLIPIFYLAQLKLLSFKEGFIWGIVIYLLHFDYLFFLVHEKGEGDLKFLAPIFCLFYFALYSGIFFWIANLVSSHFKWKLACWIIFIFLYIYFVYSWIFWIFQYSGGYVFTHPLLALVNYPGLLQYLNLLGIWVTTFFILIFNATISHFLASKQQRSLIFPLFALIFLIISFMSSEKKSNKIFTGKIGYINLSKSIQKNPFDLANEIKIKILEIIKKKPEIKIIVLPESAFPFPLNNFQEVINWWYCDLKDKTVHILIGSHREESGNLYNTVYHLYNNQIINYYDKTNLMFFSEYIPPFWQKFEFINNLFLKDSRSFKSGKNEICFNIDNFCISPCICSDIFLQKNLNNAQNIIFFFMNESWFSVMHIKIALFNYIALKELELNKAILCISNEGIS